MSYLPPLNADAIAKQVDYILRNGWIPCIEFDMVGTISQTNFMGLGYYDNMYWTMWKLPLFSATDSSLVLAGDRGGQEGVSRGLHPCDGLRQREAGADGRIHRPEACLDD